MYTKSGLVASFALACISFSHAEVTSKTVFLHCHLDHGIVSVTKQETRDGLLKPFRGEPEGGEFIFYDVYDRNRDLVWRGRMADPTVINHEGLHPKENTFQGLQRTILMTTDFELRLPANVRAHSVVFYRTGKIETGDSGWPAKQRTTFEGNHRRVLGEIFLPEF